MVKCSTSSSGIRSPAMWAISSICSWLRSAMAGTSCVICSNLLPRLQIGPMCSPANVSNPEDASCPLPDNPVATRIVQRMMDSSRPRICAWSFTFSPLWVGYKGSPRFLPHHGVLSGVGDFLPKVCWTPGV